MLTAAAFDFIEQLDGQTDIASLIQSFQALIAKFGLDCFLVGDPTQPKVPRAGRLWASTWPADWLSHWIERNYIAVDPVINQLLMRNEPVRWHDARQAADDLGRRILDEAGQFRLTDGFTVPVYTREGIIVGITMGGERLELGRQDETCLHLAAIYFHAKLERLRQRALPLSGAQKLTPRERECLSWVASGKTDWEISQILNISEQTAHEYVQNALIKLNATTRAQAVATAIFTKQMFS
ncbi:MAG TPA: LuxR family transcriptional regulator [Rhizomicrobium sp.]|nr:LuxR family transcriptional regulator [Rhizomicrobium sp.]